MVQYFEVCRRGLRPGDIVQWSYSTYPDFIISVYVFNPTYKQYAPYIETVSIFGTKIIKTTLSLSARYRLLSEAKC